MAAFYVLLNHGLRFMTLLQLQRQQEWIGLSGDSGVSAFRRFTISIQNRKFFTSKFRGVHMDVLLHCEPGWSEDCGGLGVAALWALKCLGSTTCPACRVKNQNCVHQNLNQETSRNYLEYCILEQSTISSFLSVCIKGVFLTCYFSTKQKIIQRWVSKSFKSNQYPP